MKTKALFLTSVLLSSSMLAAPVQAHHDATDYWPLYGLMGLILLDAYSDNDVEEHHYYYDKHVHHYDRPRQHSYGYQKHHKKHYKKHCKKHHYRAKGDCKRRKHKSDY